MFDLVNPIPPNFVDDNKIFDRQGKYGIVPYYSTDTATSHCWLDLLQDVSELSPSIAAIKESFCLFSFDGGIDIGDKIHLGYNPKGIEPSEHSESEKMQYLDQLSDMNISPLNIIEWSKCLEVSMIESGNMYLKIQVVINDEGPKVNITPVHYKHCAYLRKGRYESNKSLVYTKKWDETYWAKNKPQVIPSTEFSKSINWSEKTLVTGSKVYETIVHYKRKGDDSDYYGRPKLLSVMDWVLTEVNYGKLTNKVSNTEIISKTILAFEKPNSSTNRGGKDSSKSRFRKMMTSLIPLVSNKGDRQDSKSIIGLQYPNGGTPPTPINLDVNRDHEFQDTAINQAKDMIYSVHNWTPVITGRERPKSGLGSDTLMNTYLTYNYSTILPKQRFYSNFWNWIFDGVFEKVGLEKSELGIVFNSLIKKMIDDIKE